jgi:ribosome-associated protein
MASDNTKKPATKKVVTKKPATKKVVTKKPATKKVVTKKPATKKTVTPLYEIIFKYLDESKGREITCLDVSNISELIDTMVFVTGRSSRHIYSVAINTAEMLKEKLKLPTSIEGDKTSDWVLVDAGDVVINLMTEDSRLFYAIEKLWLEEGKRNIITLKA